MHESTLFANAILKDPEARREYLDDACGENTALRARLESLLAAHDNPASFLKLHDDPAGAGPEADGPTRDYSNSASRVSATGDRVGPYKLLQQIGEGGMGVVYMAEQVEPVRRRVALKIIKPGMDSKQVIARFEAERQALAMMDHPNIAKVLDAGTTGQGHPYFVMELVHGLPITEYCDQEKLAPRDRLTLFADVCRAVQHAHQKGIIHRDLKPSNIMVAEYDGRPVPKIIDFGVAKATGPQLTDKTLFTEFGQVIGTLEYMSPEQARRNQLDVDTRSDIYALGIVLYVLLTGETPFGAARFREAAWDEMLKIIREEEPQRPSVKIGTSPTIEQIAERRNVAPQRLSALVRGDLDWIAMKALEKDRTHRYASANELADDIARHLAEQPIAARPPSSLDRVTKFYRRNKRRVIGTSIAALIAIVFAGLMAGMVFTRAKETERRTERVEQAHAAASLAIGSALAAPIHRNGEWIAAESSVSRLSDLLEDGSVERGSYNRALALVESFEDSAADRALALQIEDTIIRLATNPELSSWERMEADFRALFRQAGFDLDEENPQEVAIRIRDHRSAAQLTDALELWIATRGQISAMGGRQATRANMQPWADAIYVADTDPIRTGIRKFIYEGHAGRDDSHEYLDDLMEGVELASLNSRTLAWLGVLYASTESKEQADKVFEVALRKYPGDTMLVFDYALALEQQDRWQEAIRMYHRCVALRSDVPGLWERLAAALEKVDESAAAEKARQRAAELSEASA